MEGKNSTIQRNYSRKDGTGVQSGLTENKEFKSDQTMSDSAFNQDGSGQQGYTRQVKGKRSNMSVSEKGYSFDLEG